MLLFVLLATLANRIVTISQEQVQKRHGTAVPERRTSMRLIAVHVMDTDDVVKVFKPVRHGRWVDNHCTACGMMPMGEEMWRHCDFDPPRFELFMDYCPSCGAKMDLEG